MNKKEILTVLGENVTNIGYVNEAALLFVTMLAELGKTDTLMMRIEIGTNDDHLPLDIIKNRVEWELKGQTRIAVLMKECLEIVGDMTNGRDGACEPIIQLHKEAVEGLDMIIQKQSDFEKKNSTDK